jgi:hypothetical protein
VDYFAAMDVSLEQSSVVRGGRYRKDYPGGESSKRAGGAGSVVCRERPQVHADRPGSRATVAVVARGADGGGVCRDPDRDAAPQGGAGRDETEDRSQRRAPAWRS